MRFGYPFTTWDVEGIWPPLLLPHESALSPRLARSPICCQDELRVPGGGQMLQGPAEQREACDASGI